MSEIITIDEEKKKEENKGYIENGIEELDKEIKKFECKYNLYTPTNQSRWYDKRVEIENISDDEIENISDVEIEKISNDFKQISGKYKALDILVFRTMLQENRFDFNVFRYSVYQLKRLAKDINNIIIKYDFLHGEKINLDNIDKYIKIVEDGLPDKAEIIGGKKSKKQPKKEILGVMRCIYKIPGDRKEYVKHKGKLITIKDFKEFMKPKKQAKPKKQDKPKKQTKAKKAN